MIEYTISRSRKDLKEILELQKKNLRVGLSKEEAAGQGFVFLEHNFKTLEKLNNIDKHIIAKENDKVIGYVLTTTKKSKYDLPKIFPLFKLFDHLKYKGKTISDWKYMLVGQVCVDKAYRGKGVFMDCYQKYQENYSSKYDFAITEISKSNLRSRNAHKKVGFEEIHEYSDSKGGEWVVVLWDWKENL